MFAIVGAGIVYTVEFTHFSLAGIKTSSLRTNSSPIFSKGYYRERTDFPHLKDQGILVFHWDSFKTVCICGSGFTLFLRFSEEDASSSSSFANGSQILFQFRFIKKIQLPGKSTGHFSLEERKTSYEEERISSFRLSRSWVSASSRLLAASTVAWSVFIICFRSWIMSFSSRSWRSLELSATVFPSCFWYLYYTRKQQENPSKTTVFQQYLKMPKIQGNKQPFMHFLVLKSGGFYCFLAVRYQCLTSASQTHSM